MITLLPMATILRYVAILYAAIVTILFLLVWHLFGEARSNWANLTTAITGATALQVTLVFWFYVGWRRLWSLIPQLNRWFPDIGGEWQMEIHWTWRGKSGCVNDAKAIVKQDFLRMSIEVISINSQSQTLIAQPKKDPESGAPLLFYVYLVQPKAIGTKPASPYQGAAILRFNESGSGELCGNYWTTEQSFGHFRLYGRK